MKSISNGDLSIEPPDVINLGRSEFRRWEEDQRARGWLADNVRKAGARLTDQQTLCKALADVVESDDIRHLLDAFCDRIPREPEPFQQSVATTLVELTRAHPGPGASACTVDRAVRRLLPHLSSSAGRDVALRCLESPRRPRRLAAWAFYRIHGLDTESRQTMLNAADDEDHVEFVKLVTTDAELVERIGPQVVLDAAPNRYWRSIAIEGLVTRSPAVADALCEKYPAEWLWAVGRRGDTGQLRAVMETLAANMHDPGIVNRVLLCVMALGVSDAVETALRAAAAVLAEPGVRAPQSEK